MDFEEVQDDVEEVQDEMDEIFGGDPTIQDQASKKDAVIFLVDCRPCMFKNVRDEKETQIHKVLKAFQSFVKTKIISSIDDRIGLIFYNIKNDNNPLSFHGINEVYGLDSPSADRIKNCLKIEQTFEKDYGFAPHETALHECLWLCTHEFKNLDKNKYGMRIFLFTSEDSPHFKDQNGRDQTIKHARQLKTMDVQIELFPLYRDNDSTFNLNKFYSEIITVDLDEINNSVMDSSMKIMDLHQRIKQKEFRKRALNRVLLEVDDVEVGFKIFCLINKARKPIGKAIERKSNSMLKKKTQFICADTGETLYPNQIGTYLPLGNEKIPLSKEEMGKVKSFEKPGMKLIGFKPLSTLKDYHNYRTSYFLYPDEDHVNGSSQFSDALISQMILKQRLAIVRLVPKQGSQVRFCALVAQQEQFDEDHFQRPPGLHLVFLPYADDIRGLQSIKPEGREITRETLNAAKIMVNALTLQDFSCSNFEDPSIQKFFAYLQGHALTEQQIDEPEDLLQPDYQGMEKYREQVEFFQRNVDSECQVDAPKKRGGGRGRGATQQQSSKIEVEDDFDEPQPTKRGRGRGRKQ